MPLLNKSISIESEVSTIKAATWLESKISSSSVPCNPFSLIKYASSNNVSTKISYKIVGILDDNKKLFKKNYKGIPIHIGLENAKQFKDCEFVFGIGSYKNRNSREKIFKKMQLDKNRFPNIIDRTVVLESNVKLGFGNIIYPNSVICSGTRISDFCILNYSTIIAHSFKLGAFSLIG